MDSAYYSSRDREKNGTRMKCERLVCSMNPDTISPLLRENDDVRFDQQIRARLKFRKSIAGYAIEIRGEILTSEHILDIIHVINYLKRNNIHNVSIHIRFIECSIADKLVYVTLEDLCYYFLINVNCRLYIQFIKRKVNILTDGIIYSALMKLPNKEAFLKSYTKDISARHYRTIIKASDCSGSALSVLNQDTTSFLVFNGIKKTYSDRLSEVIVEIVGNACEHGESDCLLDIDVTDLYQKEHDSNISYYGVNVVVSNYSKHLFYDLLKEKMDNLDGIQGRYNLVSLAKKNHHKFWQSNEYTEEDFYTISSFQHKISGSCRKPLDVGGTGLTTLIRSLEDYSDSNRCYLLSGCRCLMFESNYLKYNDDHLIGVNKSNDYINDVPDKNILAPCKVFFPGCAYNLHFVLKSDRWE